MNKNALGFEIPQTKDDLQPMESIYKPCLYTYKIFRPITAHQDIGRWEITLSQTPPPMEGAEYLGLIPLEAARQQIIEPLGEK